MHDLRLAFRNLRKQPAFSAVAILTLAFGIGVNASLFSLVSAFFFQPLPIKDPQQLVLVMQRADVINLPFGWSYPDYLDYRSGTTVFSDLAVFMPMPVHLSARGHAAERTWIEVVSPNYFALAKVAPALGDLPHAGDPEGRGTAPTVVLSYAYWQRRFGGDRSIVGRPITLNGRTFTVLGVAPANFTGLSWAMAVSGWVPAGGMGTLMDGGDAFRENRGIPAFRIMGRLLPGKTMDDARAQVSVITARLVAQYPAEHKGTRMVIIPESRARPDPSVSDFLPVFAVIFAAMVALVLLIACANVANLMMSRAIARQRDLVVRAALGAGRMRLIRLQVVESLVLAAAGGVLGFGLAQLGGLALSSLNPTWDIPVVETRGWDWRVYAFTIVVSIVAGLAAGFWPARRAARFDVAEALKEGGTVIGGSRHRLRNLLVVAQVTLSLVVLVSAGLFLHSLRQMQTVALGFRPGGLLMMSMDLGLQQYSDERGRRFVDELIARAKALPGVSSATMTSHIPFYYGMMFSDVSTGSVIPGSKDGFVSAAYTAVGPKFFETMGTTLMTGRWFDSTDTEKTRHVAVVNETMARTLWPDGDALGKRFLFGHQSDWIEVVGIARDGKYVMLAESPRAYFYVPLSQHFQSSLTLMVRSSTEPSSLVAPLKQITAGLDPDLPVYNVRTMDEHIRSSVFGLMPMRMGASIAAVQGFVGLLLAVMGLYAVVSYAVSRRTREIGIRMALGAKRGDVLRLVVREGMRLSIIGIVIGLLMASGLSFILSKVLFGLAPLDAMVFGAVTLLLVAVCALACYVPARRATRVDPLVALRYE